MSLVINGSGSITGLAVGGLPDGTVDSGTLATNSVDSAELIDGAVDDSHMAAMAASKLSGTVATARLPAGTVLQVVVGETTTQTVHNTTSFAATHISAAITPSSTSSKILVSVTSNMESNANGEYGWFSIHRGSTNIIENCIGQQSFTGSPIFPIAIQKLDSPSSTNAVTYTLYIKRTVATIVANINRNGINSIASITLMEIKG